MVDALATLLHDGDPNIRAVAAISLGQTGTQESKVIDHLIALLDDKDRICRQSACLSLGHMKAEKAVSKISYLWYVRILHLILIIHFVANGMKFITNTVPPVNT